MRLKEIIGLSVLDKDANEVGKIADLDFEPKEGKIEKLVVSLKKGILSNDQVEIDYGDIATIGDYVLLVGNIPQKTENVKVEKD